MRGKHFVLYDALLTLSFCLFVLLRVFPFFPTAEYFPGSFGIR